ncbi:MAG TPA: rhomboid family intramembrane serine protease [Solirubrobacteraceae bacterium]|nr:rhomboid family intramembrane serine protease [Solirubrobacteraceae bacterium]
MSTGSGPDLFVICKSCGSEVSPYITECPYCGNRLRKRAPKLDRQGRISERRSRRSPSPALPRLRRGEMPGIRPEARPVAALALVILGIAGCLVWRTQAVSLVTLAAWAPLRYHWWRAFTSPFVYDNTGYAFVALTAIALYGVLLERRHGPVPVLVLFLLGGAGGAALSAHFTNQFILGGNGAGLALLTAWAMPDVLAVRSGRDIDGDLIGTAVIAGVLALMPLAVVDASWLSDVVGVAAGLLIGLPLARLRPV